MSPLSTDTEQTHYFCLEKNAFSSNYVLQNPLGLLYMSVNPVVKFQFGLEAAGSASCNETLFFHLSQQRLLLQPWLPLMGKILRFGRSLENSRNELAADACIYKDAKTLEKMQTDKQTKKPHNRCLQKIWST